MTGGAAKSHVAAVDGGAAGDGAVIEIHGAVFHEDGAAPHLAVGGLLGGVTLGGCIKLHAVNRARCDILVAFQQLAAVDDGDGGAAAYGEGAGVNALPGVPVQADTVKLPEKPPAGT